MIVQNRASRYGRKKRRNDSDLKIKKQCFIICNTNDAPVRGKVANDFIDENKKLKYAKLKYDLNDLFTNTPLFDSPPESYEDTHGHDLYSPSKWGRISKMIMANDKYKLSYIK